MDFWKGQNPNNKGFFDIITMKDATGKEIKIFRGFAQAGGLVVKKMKVEILDSAKLGKIFGRKMVEKL